MGPGPILGLYPRVPVLREEVPTITGREKPAEIVADRTAGVSLKGPS